jgi:hypothetical protein
VAIAELENFTIEQHDLTDTERDRMAKHLGEKLRDRLGYPKNGRRASKESSRYIPLPEDIYHNPQSFYIEVTDPTFNITVKIIATGFTYHNVKYPSLIEVSHPSIKKPLVNTIEANHIASLIVAHQEQSTQ